MVDHTNTNAKIRCSNPITAWHQETLLLNSDGRTNIFFTNAKGGSTVEANSTIEAKIKGSNPITA